VGLETLQGLTTPTGTFILWKDKNKNKKTKSKTKTKNKHKPVN